MTQDFDQYINGGQEPYSAPMALAASGRGNSGTRLWWPRVRLLRRAFWESSKKPPLGSPELFKALIFLLCPSWSCFSHACALPCTPLMKILISQVDFLGWPQTCLSLVTCLAISGMCWLWLLLPDLLYSASLDCLWWDLVSLPFQRFQKPIYQIMSMCCSFQQNNGFQLLKSSSILEFVGQIWKLETFWKYLAWKQGCLSYMIATFLFKV